MLVDDVLAYPTSPEIKKVLPIQHVGFQVLAEDVSQAQRFVLQRDAVFLIHSLCDLSMTRLLPALQICRLPFPKMWVEFVHRDRDDWFAATNARLTNMEDASPPSRMGYFLEQKDKEGRLIEFTLVWRHNYDPNMKSEAIVIGNYSMTIDTTPGVEISEQTRANFHRAQTRPSEIEKRFELNRTYDDPAEHEAALELETRIKLRHCRYMLPFWAYMAETAPHRIKALEEHGVFDCLYEWRFILSLLTVLNSRNVISYSEPITYEKLNKQRAKKNLPLMHDHREIRLSFSRVQRNRVGDSNGLVDIQAHTVRGHWKLRRSGLYWWSQHIRGSGLVRSKPYIIKG